jgi:hypothetical protein
MDRFQTYVSTSPQVVWRTLGYKTYRSGQVIKRPGGDCLKTDRDSEPRVWYCPKYVHTEGIWDMGIPSVRRTGGLREFSQSLLFQTNQRGSEERSSELTSELGG